MAQNSQLPWWQKFLYTDTKPADDRSRILQVANNLVLHLHPTSVPAPALRFRYTWGVGGISALLVMVLGLTGLLLMFRYDARVDYAYISIQKLETRLFSDH